MTRSNILIIYTGGTIGMVRDPLSGALSPFDFDSMMDAVPGLSQLEINIDAYSFPKLIDSSDMGPEGWIEIANVIEKNYDKYHGFVVLHGTDTMAYTASALSFMLENLGKPVILTGSQLPIGVLRSDGKDNLINSLEIAATFTPDGKSKVTEVCVYFENTLYRGNRVSKFSAEYFNAFISGNCECLAKVGIHVKWNENIIRKNENTGPLKVHTHLDTNVTILKIHPGISLKVVEAILSTPHLKGVVMETYGSGNAPTNEKFITLLKTAIERGLSIVNVSQCTEGSVEMGKYDASSELKSIGLINGYDLTTESALTKMMFLLGKNLSQSEFARNFIKSICGEMTAE